MENPLQTTITLDDPQAATKVSEFRPFSSDSTSTTNHTKNPISPSNLVKNHRPNPNPSSMDVNSSPKSNNTISVFSTFVPPSSADAKSSSRKPINLWPGMYHSPVTEALWEARSKIFERLLDPPKDAPPQSDLLTKTPSDSRTTILYNFSNDYILREQYKDPWNEVRIGKLLEDLDALAGTISVKVPQNTLFHELNPNKNQFYELGCLYLV